MLCTPGRAITGRCPHHPNDGRRVHMRALTKKAGALADRVLGLVVPHTAARATDCSYECCSARNYWHYCCDYPNGSRKCGQCITGHDATQAC
jgi:hypothetical protein